jgi:sodium/proline symporter
VLAFAAAIVVSLLTYRHNEEIQQEFTDTGAMLAVPRPHAVGDTP